MGCGPNRVKPFPSNIIDRSGTSWQDLPGGDGVIRSGNRRFELTVRGDSKEKNLDASKLQMNCFFMVYGLSPLYRRIIVAVFVASVSPLPAEQVYIKYVKPIKQEKIRSPRNSNQKDRLEGCGPVALASLLGYWHTERGKSILRDFDGKKHPRTDLKKLYTLMNSRAHLTRQFRELKNANITLFWYE